MEAVKKPCPECPFSRSVKPGALGGSEPLVYIGQAYGAFVLPCHKHCDFDDPSWREKAGEVGQCAGAAVFRGHLGVSYPAAIPILPADSGVFSDEYEFLAHHMGLTVEEVKSRYSRAVFVNEMVRQYRRAIRKEKP